MYLNNKDLYVEIIVSKAQGKLTRNAEKMLELLAKKTIKKINLKFSGYNFFKETNGRCAKL